MTEHSKAASTDAGGFATTAALHATIIVCTFRRDQVLVDTLSHLIALNAEDEHEIVVVDQQPNHPPHIQAELDAMNASSTIRLLTPQIAGLTHARNIGAAAASNPILVYCDDDIIPCATLLTAHLECYAEPSTAAVAGQVLEQDESPTDPP